MSGKTAIEWTEATWNPTVGCKAVSPGCDNCYAAREASGRLRGIPVYAGLAEGGVFTGEVRMLPGRLDQPLRWRKPRRIFVNSMSDLFHPDVPDEFIVEVFGVMAAAPQHTFHVLTKRPQRMASVTEVDSSFINDVAASAFGWSSGDASLRDRIEDGSLWPLPNVWLGCSVESQSYAFRVRHLLDTPAAVRFVSAEPLLGPLDLFGSWDDDCEATGVAVTHQGGSYPTDYGTGIEYDCHHESGIDWVICGGESGPGARPMHPDWARSLRDQCTTAGVPYFFKQWGEYIEAEPGPGTVWQTGEGAHGAGCQPWTPDSAGATAGRWGPFADATMRRVGKKAAGRELDGRTWDEYPEAVTA